jgi:hypothetical protein
VIDKERSHKPSFSTHCRAMAANTGAIDHALPVVCQPEINQRLQEGIPDALFSPTPEPDIDRVPFAISLVLAAPGSTGPWHVEHTIQVAPVIARRPHTATPLRRQQRSDKLPFRVRQTPTTHDCSSKSSHESEVRAVGNPFCQYRLEQMSAKVTFGRGRTVSGRSHRR